MVNKKKDSNFYLASILTESWIFVELISEKAWWAYCGIDLSGKKMTNL